MCVRDLINVTVCVACVGCEGCPRSVFECVCVCAWLCLSFALAWHLFSQPDVALKEISQQNVASTRCLALCLPISLTHSVTHSRFAGMSPATRCVCVTNAKTFVDSFPNSKLARAAIQISISVCHSLPLSLSSPLSPSSTVTQCCMLHELQLGELSQIAFPA